MKAVISASGLQTFDAVIPNEIGGINAFEALLAAHRFGKSTLDTDCVARAYPYVWQTVRCLNGVLVTPSAVANGRDKTEVCFSIVKSYIAQAHTNPVIDFYLLKR